MYQNKFMYGKASYFLKIFLVKKYWILGHMMGITVSKQKEEEQVL